MPGTYSMLDFPAECSTTVGGLASFILLVALPIAVLLTWLTVVLYRHAVLRAMRSISPDSSAAFKTADASAGTPPPAALQFDFVDSGAQLPGSPLVQHAIRSSKRAGFAYAVAGIVHALIATVLTFSFGDLAFLPVRLATVLLLYAWPVIPTLMLTSVDDLRVKWALLLGYFTLIFVLDGSLTIFGWRDGGMGGVLIVWLVWMGPPSLLLWILNNRAWRSVGLPAYLVAIGLVSAYLLATQGFGCLALALNDANLWFHYHTGVLLLALALVAAGVWWMLRSIAHRYREKRLSSQSLTLDSWWLVITLAETVIQFDTTRGASLSFILAYMAYKGISTSLQRLPASPVIPPASLLLLRVFGHRQRSRRLLDQLNQRWSFIGPISLIGAPDLAATNLEPDELLQFWGLRLRTLFVASGDDLQHRLASFDARPDPDGRYRINEFFCYDNTWKATVHALAQRSDTVLMDLRGFGEENRGCQFELQLLLAEVPLARIVLLIDTSTQREVLTGLLTDLWQGLPKGSLNWTLENPRLRIFHTSGLLHSVAPLLHRVATAEAG